MDKITQITRIETALCYLEGCDLGDYGVKQTLQNKVDVLRKELKA